MNTTLLGKGTLLETIESQTQQNMLHLELPNRAEEAKKKREVKAIFEVMAEVRREMCSSAL